MAKDPESVANVRDIIGHLIGLRLVDITQHDKDEYDVDHKHYVMLMFEDGHFLRFDVENGFLASRDEPEQGEAD